jgi:hypothetical protein
MLVLSRSSEWIENNEIALVKDVSIAEDIFYLDYEKEKPAYSTLFFRTDNNLWSLTYKFIQLARQWRYDIEIYSSVSKIISHPSYLEIIAMGESVLPLIFTQMKKDPYHWFVALTRITGESPAKQGCTFDEAVKAWLDWGEAKGYI